MALPSGSIRAVIALSLVVVFAILAVFLFSSLDNGGRVQKLSCLDAAEKNRFVDNLGPQQILLTLETTGEPCPGKEATAAGPPGPTASTTPGPAQAGAAAAPSGTFFTVYYKNFTDPSATDFAKQLLVLIGTLVTAVASFYFGAKAVSDGQAAATPGGPPRLVGVQPVTAPPGGRLHPLRITGSNLNSVARAQLVSGDTQILDTSVVSNPSLVQANFEIPTTAAPDSRWDVVVTDDVGRTATLPRALQVTVGPSAAAPSVTTIDPTTAPPGGEVKPLRITGSNLNSIVQAQLVSGDTQLAGTEVAATPTQVQANFQIPTTAALNSRWDLVVTDDAGRTATLPAALQVTTGPAAPAP